MFNKIRKKYKKRVMISLVELYEMAEQSGVNVKQQPEYKVNDGYFNILDNDTPVIYEGWSFYISDPFDKNNPHKPLNTFECYVGMEYCEHCEEMENFRKFNDKYNLCSKCFKSMKKDWNRKESTFRDFIDSRIVLNKLND